MVLIFLVALLVFGAKRLPDIARGLGQGIREFRNAAREVADELQLEEGHRPRPIRPPAQHIAAPHPAPPPAPVREEEQPADDQQPLLSDG